MAEDEPSLHIDTDWKKQAQQEKKRLAEEEAKRAAAGPPRAAATPGGVPVGASSAPSGARGGAARGAARDIPPASFPTLVQSLMTQALFYLGELSPQGGEGGVNLDMAKHQIDTLGVVEDKSKGNLTPDEQRLLDAALYETRMRYVSVASQYL